MNLLADYLKRNNVSQNQFAKPLGVQPCNVSQWVKGDRPISIEKALLIEKIYGLDAEELAPKLTTLIELINERGK